MSRAFEGMNRRERDAMPMVGEATGIQLSTLIARPRYKVHPLLVRVSLRQEHYVREVYMRCPRSRRSKKQALRRALDHATAVADLNCRQALNLPTPDPKREAA